MLEILSFCDTFCNVPLSLEQTGQLPLDGADAFSLSLVSFETDVGTYIS